VTRSGPGVAAALAAAAAAIALLLAGCTTLVVKTPVTFTVSCTSEDASGATVAAKFPDFRAAWAGGQPWTECTATKSGGNTHTQLQLAATELAGFDGFAKLPTLYALCGETGGYFVVNDKVSPAQAAEIEGMLAICPDFPYADDLNATSLEAQHAAETARGRRFGDGTWLVGSQVQPGSYLASDPTAACAWQRLDKNSHVIDQNTVDGATFVQVAVGLRDHAIHSEGCGDFVRIG
jgi:hypothetical protein